MIRKHYYWGPLRALVLKGYEIGGSSTQHGIVRVEISLNGQSAWVEVGQQARDLAAGKITLTQIRASSNGAPK
jgi:hypothetical protein